MTSPSIDEPSHLASVRRLTVWTLGITLIQIAWGAFTRGSGAGYGCADRWPLCEGGLIPIGSYGGLLPQPEFNMVVEWMHRWIALAVLAATIVLARRAWKLLPGRPELRLLTIGAIGVVIVQSLLGAWVVISDLDRDLITVHLLNAMVLLALLALTRVRTTEPAGAPSIYRTSYTVALIAGAGLVAATLVLGSLTHDFHAFDGWPIPNDGLVPEFAVPKQAQHYAHRITAALSIVVLGWLAWRARQTRSTHEARALTVAAIAATANAGLGGVHVFTEVSVTIAIVGHLFLAALSWTALCTALAHRFAEPHSSARALDPAPAPAPVGVS